MTGAPAQRRDGPRESRGEPARRAPSPDQRPAMSDSASDGSGIAPAKKSHRSSLNPMSESFLDKIEDLNRSASGMDMIAPGAYAAGGRAVRVAPERRPRTSMAGGLFPVPSGMPRPVVWGIYAAIMVTSAVGLVVSLMFVLRMLRS